MKAWPTEAQTITMTTATTAAVVETSASWVISSQTTGQEVDGDETAAEEADHRQDADDESLAVADDREPHGGEQQQDVQHVHRQ